MDLQKDFLFYAQIANMYFKICDLTCDPLSNTVGEQLAVVQRVK